MIILKYIPENLEFQYSNLNDALSDIVFNDVLNNSKWEILELKQSDKEQIRKSEEYKYGIRKRLELLEIDKKLKTKNLEEAKNKNKSDFIIENHEYQLRILNKRISKLEECLLK